MGKQKVVCFGEVLWDLFPEGKKLGGAPFNVASSLSSLGAEVCFISRIGEDDLGIALLQEIDNQGVAIDFIQRDSNHKTGEVIVSLNAAGNPSYEIAGDAALDFIEIDEKVIEVINQSRAFIFGSLIARGSSYAALTSFLSLATFRVFDLNLRPPHYDYKLLENLMHQADMLKFNDEELYEVAGAINSPYHSMDQHIKYIAQQTQTEIICVTKGRFGAVLYYKGKRYFNSGFKVKVEDTVGAGDSFLATLVYSLLEGDSPQLALNRACAMGALVAGSLGANPDISMKDLKQFMGKGV